MKIFNNLCAVAQKRGGAYFILIDPDTRRDAELKDFVREICQQGADAILVGGSLIIDTDFQNSIKIVRENSTLPIIIFPGSVQQLSYNADAILYLSLISGRNPNYLFGDHVVAAPFIKKIGIEPISTGYMLFESGSTTTAEFMSNTKPLPINKPEIAMAHALAAQYFGMSVIYMEAGSGAKHSIPSPIVKAVAGYVDIPVIVGGGIRTPEEAHSKVKAGATFIVTGNIYDNSDNIKLISEFARAIHIKENS
jgi:phosphoglycerol geranylgeranyltransferase